MPTRRIHWAESVPLGMQPEPPTEIERPGQAR
jgi:hypothetical protein